MLQRVSNVLFSFYSLCVQSDFHDLPETIQIEHTNAMVKMDWFTPRLNHSELDFRISVIEPFGILVNVMNTCSPVGLHDDK